MRIRFLVAVACVLVLAGCRGSRTEEEPQAIPAETTASTTTTVAPTTTTPNGLGVTQTHRIEEPGYEGGTSIAKITVFRYRDASALQPDVEADLARQGQRTVAIEVRVCIVKELPDVVATVNWEPWSLGDDQGQSFEALGSYSGEITAQPTYPDGKSTPVGTCRRGWVPFQVARKWQPDFVEYNPGLGDVLKWPIRK